MKFGVFCALLLLAALPALCQNQVPVWGSLLSPNSGDKQNEIRGMAPVSSSDVWALGDYNSGVVPTVTGRRTLIEHWNGRSWNIVPSTQLDLPGYDAVILEDALALASNNIWVVGHAEDFSSLNSATLIAHYDGANWSLVPSPNPSGNTLPDALYAIARAGNRLYAVGETNFPGSALILAWNGSGWHSVANHCVGPLRGISAVSSSTIFAAGSYTACRFNGTSWENMPLPPLGNGQTYALHNVAAISANDVWLVGSVATPNSGGEGGGYTFTSVALHWNGSSWITYNNVPGSELDGVLARSSNNIWAVGTQSAGGIIVHWNGQEWRQEPSPANLYGAFQDIKSSSTGEMWTGGSSLNAQGMQSTLIARAPSNKAVVQGNTGASQAVVTWVGPASGSASTDVSGRYVVPDLPVGAYTFIASLAGCTPSGATLTLAPNTIINQDLPISCGSAPIH
ncbi:MAG: carboxypeptidase-like regulatory domain-containing protein [Bryobacteraceae bacterium]